MKSLNELELPMEIDLNQISVNDFVYYFKEHRNDIDSRLKEHGALKFKGIIIDTLNDFQLIVDSISTKFMTYVDGNSPRTKLTGNVYTSTEYDCTQRITMHNELSYSAKWPGILFFSCLQPGESGGETLLADSREILKIMDPRIVETIEKKGITYIRNLHGGQGMGPSWQQTFETDEKADVEKYCDERNIEYSWTATGNLRIFQTVRGIIRHRETNDLLWFNQIDQFHPSHLQQEVYEVISVLYSAPEDFPMFVRFGDRSEIPEWMVSQIIETIDQVTVAPSWGKNQFLMIDNERICHGRNPYTGTRKVLVAMAE